MSDQPYDFGSAFRYYDSVRTSNDLLESHVARRAAENLSSALDDAVISPRAENVESASTASDGG